jgi:nicotinamide mononucleotide (NMN) deamidase PncC
MFSLFVASDRYPNGGFVAYGHRVRPVSFKVSPKKLKKFSSVAKIMLDTLL